LRSGFLWAVVGGLVGVVLALTLQRPIEHWLNQREQSTKQINQLLASAENDRATFTETGFNSSIDKYNSVSSRPGPIRAIALQGLSRTYSDWTALRFRLGLSRGSYPDKALTYALRAAAVAPKDVYTELAIAHAYQALGRYSNERAAAKAKVIELLDHKYSDAGVQFELNYLDWISAASNDGKSFPDRLDPNNVANVRVLVDAGMDLAERGRKSTSPQRDQYLKRASEFCNRAVLVQPGNQVGSFCLGYVAMVLDNKLEAIRQYGLAVQGTSEFPRAHNNLGFIYAGDGQFSAAAEQFDAAVKTLDAPTTSLGLWLYNLGAAYLESSANDKAISVWRRAAELPGAGDSYPTEWGLAMSYYIGNKPQNALEHYRRAVELASKENINLTDIHAFEQSNAGPRELAIARQLITMSMLH